MAIKRYTANADNTITNAFEANLQTRGTGSNMGMSDILETFVIYGQANSSSLEEARILVNFPIADIITDRDAGLIPASGNMDFYLRIHNAPHGQTLPKDFTARICPVSASWQEGYGLDMETYSDLGTSNWLYGDPNTPWHWEGADCYMEDRNFQHFEDGTEDIEIDVSTVVEKWIIMATGSGGMPRHGFLIAIQGDPMTQVGPTTDPFTVNVKSGSVTVGYGGVLPTAKTWTTMTAEEKATFTAGTSCYETVTSTPQPYVSWLTLDAGSPSSSYIDPQATELIEVMTTDPAEQFANRDGIIPACTFLSGTSVVVLMQNRILFDNNENAALDISIELPNVEPLFDRSYYTKKFFARGSEHFYLRPKLEARWDSARKDRRNSFYASSSLVPGTDNLNTLYLYNQVRGQLQDIPAVGTGELSMSLYYGASTAPAGTALTCSGPDGIGVTQVTGGCVATGIYSASVPIDTTFPYLYDVWHNGAGTEYVTGSQISVRSFSTNTAVDTGEYVSNITNMKPAYATSEKPRMRMFIRDKNWNPTIYSVATTNIETKIIENAYYNVFRIADDFDVISYGTGSANAGYTQMSYDKDGNYFDVDMSLFEAGYSYGIKVSYRVNNRYEEQTELFKFRVE